jgi:hypothetical protein
LNTRLQVQSLGSYHFRHERLWGVQPSDDVAVELQSAKLAPGAFDILVNDAHSLFDAVHRALHLHIVLRNHTDVLLDPIRGAGQARNDKLPRATYQRALPMPVARFAATMGKP